MLHTPSDYVDNDYLVLVHLFVLVYIDLFFVNYFIIVDPGDYHIHNYKHYSDNLLRWNTGGEVFVRLPSAMLRIRSVPIQPAVLPDGYILHSRRNMRRKSRVYKYSDAYY